MRKGQISIFIILGLILLITIGVTLYFFSTEAGRPLRKAPKVPEDIRPVFDMVNDCAKMALKQGLLKMGLQGGYIDIPGYVLNNPNSYLTADPLGIIKIPYWYYAGENRVPSKNLMRAALGRQVKEEIKSCTDFKAFEPRLRVTELDKPDVLITFAEKGVVAEVKWPLKITTPQRTITQEEYFATVDVRFSEMHDLAMKILEEENKQEWLEKLTIDLMSSDKKIPLGGMEVGCTRKKWNIENIQKRLKKKLFYLMPLVRIKNTPQLKPLAKESVYEDLKEYGKEAWQDLVDNKIQSVKMPDYIPADAYEINKMTFDTNIPKTDLKAAITYDGKTLMLNAKPRDGRWLKSKVVRGAKQLIPFFCMNQWHFTYDIIYPVKVVIKDEKAFDGEGYAFEFAFPVIISDNAPERVNFGVRQFEPMFIGEGFCDQLGEKEAEIRVWGFEPGVPRAIDLEDVNITIQCMNVECDIGKTEAQDDGRILLKTRLPSGCGNPRVIAKKEGYLEASKFLTGKELDIVMKKLVKLKPEFVIRPYQSVMKEWQTDQNRFTLEENEQIAFSLKTKDGKFEQDLMFTKNDTTDTNKTIQLILDDKNYELEMYLLKNGELIGGYADKSWNMTYAELIGKERIQFNIIEYRPNPASEEELGEMMGFLREGEYKENLRPILTT